MSISAENAKLQQIPVSKIDRNEENPRIHFRQQELDDLLDSIKSFGIQVPLSVYKDKGRYVLIDGERRWRCAIKLNLATVPALVQEKPSRLDNILLMFNIHALREQWDLLTIALKLSDIVKLLTLETGAAPNEAELAKRTGYSRAIIRRCKLLLELPAKYREMMMLELQKPKGKQKLTEDFFIEMERALRVVEKALPEAVPDKDIVRQVLISKYKNDIIDNRVHFRQIAKIARAENVGSDVEKAEVALEKLFSKNEYSIQQAYKESVSEDYEERDVITRIETLATRLRSFDVDEVDDKLRVELRKLIAEAKRLLEGNR